MVSLAPRDNNYLIQNISQNNFAQTSKERGRHIGARARTHARTHDGRNATIYKKKPRSLTLVLDSFVPSPFGTESWIGKKCGHESRNTLYKKFHILPIDQRIFFKVCLLTHNSVHGTAPGYFKTLLDVDVVDTVHGTAPGYLKTLLDVDVVDTVHGTAPGHLKTLLDVDVVDTVHGTAPGHLKALLDVDVVDTTQFTVQHLVTSKHYWMWM